MDYKAISLEILFSPGLGLVSVQETDTQCFTLFFFTVKRAVQIEPVSITCLSLVSGAVIQLGRGTMFRFNHPKETAQLREQRKVSHSITTLANPQTTAQPLLFS